MAALYALLLQAFLITLLPVAVAAQAHAPGVMCAVQDGQAPADHGTSGPHPHVCCRAVPAAQSPTPVPSGSAAVTVAWARGVVVGWQPAALPSAHGPPDDRVVSARGPPAA